MSKQAAVSRWLIRRGFDIPRLTFGLRTALASCLALLLAWLMGLEHPQWAAMTVWAVSQPVRGMLVEKSLFRALGTVVGTLVGVCLVLVAGDNLPLMVISLSLWIGLCVGVGNLLSGLISYGALLSGYSATMVALLNTQQPTGQILLLGGDRLLTVLTGVMMGLLVGLLFTPRDAEDHLAGRVRRTTSDLLRLMAAMFAGDSREPRAQAAHRLLTTVADTEQLFDAAAAGSLRGHRSIRALRALVQAQVGGAYWIRHARNLPADGHMAALLQSAAQLVAIGAPASEQFRVLEEALARCTEQTAADVLRQLLDSQREHLATTGEHSGVASIRTPVVLHRDWTGAGHAVLRATGLLLLIGSAWIATGWSVGAYVMLSASVMITLFSTFETPSKIMRDIFIWQAIAAGAALSCHWLLWPLASSEWQLIMLLFPFILVIVPFFAHPKVSSGSIDYVMALLLLSHPVLPLERSFSDAVAIALAVIAGPLLAYIAFRTVWPADARRRRRDLTGMTLNELVNMARNPRAPIRHAVWRMRLQHRLLKLIQSVMRSAEPLQPVTSGGLAVLAVGDAIQQLHLLRRTAPPASRLHCAIDLALLRLQRLSHRPEAAARSLRRVADQLQPSDPHGAWTMENAGRGIVDNSEFFRR